METKLLINNSTFEAWAKVTTDDNGQLNMEVLSDRLHKRLTLGGIYVRQELQTEEMRKNKKSFVYLDELEKNPHQFTRFFLEITCKNGFQKPHFSWKAAEDYKGAEEERRLEEKAIQRTNVFFREVVGKMEAENINMREAIDHVTDKWQAKKVTKKMDKLSIHKHVDKTAAKPVHEIKKPKFVKLKKKNHGFVTPYNINPENKA